MKVYVKSQSGKWLMPTNPANARILLKKGKARVIQRTPFVIQLLYETTEHVQTVTVGIDDGGIQVGIAAVSRGKVLFQEELTLRSDIKSKLDTRRQYRRSRRYTR
ncbi:RRXRR domain-containing protein [Desulfobacter sp.]|uniref:RRXRR domain-containing protein n=1 Tax=Desulfobacter sp. TaxID=2294 RepID=UPI002579B02E|nr:RRXRR domain-containing protein [Desulfobacter sp.]